MEILKGIGVSPGVVISTAVVLDADDLAIPKRSIPPEQTKAELSRFGDALAGATVELVKLRDEVTQSAGKEVGQIFNFHLGLLNDRTLLKQVQAEIIESTVTAEYAFSTTIRKLANRFAQMSNAYLAERVKDIHDLEKRVLRQLLGQKMVDLASLDRDVIIIAHDLLPSQTAALDRTHVKGFACDVGGRTSHTAIVARAMGIPAVVGLGNLTSEVTHGDTVILDGWRGVVIISPDEDQLTEYREYERRQDALEIELESLRDLPAQTLDGHPISLQANIEFPAEVDDALGTGAQGIGLYRTEFLYLSQDAEPTEEDHYNSYADALNRLGGRPLVIRTLDLGADKYKPGEASQERNPFLGDRSIRMCLHDIPMFKKQLRAIMRATALGDVRIMFPMISTIMELRQARMILEDVKDELGDEGFKIRADVPVGMMIEVPSAALMASSFSKEVAFFSIGTNDLIQYTLAVDRTNERVAGLYSPAHPAVLALIQNTIRAANRAGISVSVCGEMAGEPVYTLLLLGLGLTSFSMNGPDIPEVKKIIRSTTLEHARAVARRVMSFDSEKQVTNFLRDETRKILPEAF